ncbi:MAG: Arc family DNA-binding protein [Kiritimatiellae bacterium]|nr:Arc family DNA-binding protein [Kiritimatiellia bacterium]
MAVSDDKVRTNITFPKELKERLERIAKDDNRSFNNLVITILQEYMKVRKK